MTQVSPSSKNNGTLLIIIVGVVIILAGIISYAYLRNQVSNPNDQPNNPPSTTTPPNINYYSDKTRGIEFYHPTLFKVIPASAANPKTTLMSEYFVDVDFVGEGSAGVPTEESFPPHRFAITFQNKSTALEAAMREDNQFFADTYNDFIQQKKPKTDLMEISQIDGKTAYTFTLGAEGINSKYVYIQKSQAETVVIVLTYIGDILKDSIQPSPISEAEQLKIFNTLLSTVKIK